MSSTVSILVPPLLLANASASVYAAVPAGTVVQIRKIHFSNEDTVARNVTVAIGAADTTATEIFTAYSVPGNPDPQSVQDWFGPYTLPAGYQIFAFADVAAKVNMTIDGIVLTAG